MIAYTEREKAGQKLISKAPNGRLLRCMCNGGPLSDFAWDELENRKEEKKRISLGWHQNETSHYDAVAEMASEGYFDD